MHDDGDPNGVTTLRRGQQGKSGAEGVVGFLRSGDAWERPGVVDASRRLPYPDAGAICCPGGPIALRNEVVAEEMEGEEEEEAWEKVKERQFHVWMPKRRISASSA
ncbi:hypothetical protein F5880DRAFT_1504926 [Lentinula raphanica]|nr:hypothetical protein F5880DRAFT_1504926 [Lentinula raphanica]